MSKEFTRRQKSQRVCHISTRVTDEEYDLLLARAQQEHLSISEWARRTLEKAISDAEARQVMMAELWALKFTLLNGLPQLATDPAAVHEGFRKLLTEADQRKAEKARRLLGES